MCAAGLMSRVEPEVIKGTQPNRQLGREAGDGQEGGRTGKYEDALESHLSLTVPAALSW